MPDADESAQPGHGSSHGLLAVWLAASLCALALGLSVLPYRLDDAFITYRFADRFVQDGRIAFNAGGPWVEGFSSPIWFAGLSLARVLAGVEALPLASTIAGLVSLSACLWVLARLQGAGSVVARGLPLAMFALLVPAVYYAVTGLEPLLFALVVLLYYGAVSGRVSPVLGTAAALLSAWVRPEAPWLLVGHVVAALALGRRRPSALDLRLGLALCFGVALLFACRLALFGHPFPNTYYAKPAVLAAGVEYLVALIRSPWALSALALGALGALHGTSTHRAFAGASLAWLFAPLVAGGDWMPVGRFLLPALALACAAAGGVAIVGSPRPARLALFGLLSLGFALSNLAELRGLAALARSDLESIVHEQHVLSRWLVEAGMGSVALVDIGELGFRTQLHIVDLAGLTDPQIAHAPGAHLHKQGTVDYVLREHAPDALIIRVHGAEPRDDARVVADVPAFAIEPVERALARAAEQGGAYRQVFAMLPADMRTPFYGRVVYVRRELEVPVHLKPERPIMYIEPLRM